MYLERIAALLPGSGARPGVEAPLFRSEEALWEAVERERARTSPLVALLDEHGKTMGSEAFAAWLGREQDGGRQLMVFAVGPAEGWGKRGTGNRQQGAGRQSTELRAQSTEKQGTGSRERGAGKSKSAGTETVRLSLGPMTLAHELARVVLCEQVYRALTILKGHPYHRAGNREQGLGNREAK